MLSVHPATRKVRVSYRAHITGRVVWFDGSLVANYLFVRMLALFLPSSHTNDVVPAECCETPCEWQMVWLGGRQRINYLF
jgi:hypothetical protein